ncbi:T cell receptor alpha chain constant isoform X3 [Desmodus rotundus]
MLHITTSQLEDSASYFCAAEANTAGTKLTFGGGTRVLVKPNVKNPDPAVYQPRSPKSSRTSICLFTDFDSNTDVPQATGSSAFGSNSTVLDMRSTHSKSYGALLWSDSTDFGCKGTFNKTFYPSSEFSCDVTSVEKSFETDINLNFQNLSVIGFRILLLKVAGFNLLMTLRLWSS